MEEIDPKGGKVRVRDLRAGSETWESYDRLLIATGALPLCPDVPGADAVDVCGINTLESGIRFRGVIDGGKTKNGVIIGGGYIGLEMAEALVRRGLEVTLVDRSLQVMKTLDHDMGALVSQA